VVETEGEELAFPIAPLRRAEFADGGATWIVATHLGGRGSCLFRGGLDPDAVEESRIKIHGLNIMGSDALAASASGA
jgi:hypothetical protein